MLSANAFMISMTFITLLMLLPLLLLLLLQIRSSQGMTDRLQPPVGTPAPAAPPAVAGVDAAAATASS
jgi:hypothetical protein